MFLLIALALIPAVQLLVLVYYDKYQSHRAGALHTELEVAQNIAATFTTYVEGLRQQLSILGHSVQVIAPADTEKTRVLLTVPTLSAVHSYNWLSADGVVLSSSHADEIGRDLSSEDFVQQVLAGNPWALGDLARWENVPTVGLATAVHDDHGQILGLMVAHIELLRFEELLLQQFRPYGGYYALFDRQGRLIMQVGARELTFLERDLWRYDDRLLREVLSSGRQQAGIQQLALSDEQWLSARVPIPEIGWVAGASRPVPLAMAPALSSLRTDIGLALLIGTASLLFATLIARTIAGPLRRLELNAQQLASGHVPLISDVLSPTEVHRLGETIDAMAITLLERAEQLRNSQRELRKSENLYRAIARNLPDGAVWVVDPEMNYLVVEGELVSQLQMEGLPLEGRGIDAVLADPLREQARQGFSRALAGEPSEQESDVQGRVLWTHYTPLYGENQQVLGAMAMSLDITRRTLMEEELRLARDLADDANRAKSEFLATMSHELRTPMTVFLGYLDYLLQVEENPEHRRLLELSKYSADRLRTLIEDILDFSRIEARRLELKEESFNLREGVSKAVNLLELPAAEKDLQLSVTIANDVPQLVVGDADRLGQVLINLVGNAIKFTERGAVEVAVTRQGERLLFSISDTGIGIPQEKMGMLFHIFSQLDSSNTRKFGGTGLGLAISKGLLELMGGEITVQGRPRGGSIFSFTLPLHPAPEQPQAQEGPEQEPEPTPTAVQILLAEDDPHILTLLHMALDRPGWRIVEAADGEEAVRTWQQGKFELILMDVQMPGLDGMQATRRIRDLERQRGGYTYIIGITDARHETEEYCLAAGMDQVLQKPLHIKDLLHVIETLLAHRPI